MLVRDEIKVRADAEWIVDKSTQGERSRVFNSGTFPTV